MQDLTPMNVTPMNDDLQRARWPEADASQSGLGFPRRTLGTRETRQAAFLMQRRSVGLDAIVELVSERMSGVYR